MPYTIFFSWQADTSKTEGRNLIENALNKAIKAISNDTSIEGAVRGDFKVDQGTKGTPGRPNVVDTILGKIKKAAIVVPDFTYVGMRADNKRLMPNPNVMVEYGYALATLTDLRIITVMNTAHGSPTEHPLPFDLQGAMYPIFYNCPDGASAEQRAKAREELAKDFEKDIRLILQSDAFAEMLNPKPVDPHPHDVELLKKLRLIISPELQTFISRHSFRNPFRPNVLDPIRNWLDDWVGPAYKFHDPELHKRLDILIAAGSHFLDTVNANVFLDDHTQSVLTPLRDEDRRVGLTQTTREMIKKMNDSASAFIKELGIFEQAARDSIRA